METWWSNVLPFGGEREEVANKGGFAFLFLFLVNARRTRFGNLSNVTLHLSWCTGGVGFVAIVVVVISSLSFANNNFSSSSPTTASDGVLGLSDSLVSDVESSTGPFSRDFGWRRAAELDIMTSPSFSSSASAPVSGTTQSTRTSFTGAWWDYSWLST